MLGFKDLNFQYFFISISSIIIFLSSLITLGKSNYVKIVLALYHLKFIFET